MKPSLFVACSAGLTLCCASAPAQTTPRLLPVQARLTDADGEPLADVVRVIQFQVFGEPTVGNPLWAGEIHRATINGGLVNVLLGSKNPLPNDRPDEASRSFFDAALYLQITPDASGDDKITDRDPPLLPRQVLLPVVFAQESGLARDSQKLAGFDWSSLLGANDPVKGKLDGSKIQDGTIRSNQIAPGSVTAEKLAAAAMELLAPPGTVSAYMGTNDPPGWLICDRREVTKSQYPRLHEVIGDKAGAPADPTRFRLPDLRGFFLRGANRGRNDDSRDPDVTNRVAHVGYPKDAPGSWRADELRSHQHRQDLTGGVGSHAGYWQIPGQRFQSEGGRGLGMDLHTFPQGGTEPRPKNVYVNYIIKH